VFVVQKDRYATSSTQEETGKSSLSPSDVANCFFLEMFSFETAEKILCILDSTSHAALHLRVEGPQTQALVIINNWPAQYAVCVLKVAKNFQLTRNPEITKNS
jgi:hypothetical protein